MSFKKLMVRAALVSAVSSSVFGASLPRRATITPVRPAPVTVKQSVRYMPVTVHLRSGVTGEVRNAVQAHDRSRLAQVVDNMTPARDVLQASDTGRLAGRQLDTQCLAEMTGDNLLDNRDLYAFVDYYFAGDNRADVNNNGLVSVQDIFDYVAMFVTGCAPR
jgi:hypothetical protein